MPRPRPLLELSAFLLLASCTFSQRLTPSAPNLASADVPRRVRVHVDHVKAARVADFEGARRELLAAYASHGVSEGRTFVLETDEPAFLSLRPFEHYADLDSAGEKQKDLDDAVGEATLARLDGITHRALAPPHRNEMWSLQASLTYVPEGAAAPTLATAGGGKLVEHEVMPEKDEAYEKAVESEVHALEGAHYPVSRVVYVSTYGSGRYLTLWLGARSKDIDTPLPDAAQAEEARARSAVETEVVHGLIVRGDLGSR
jgi:hypothetical protein